MEPYSRTFHPRMLGVRGSTGNIAPCQVSAYCPSTGLTFTTWQDSFNNTFVDPTCLLVAIHGSFSALPCSRCTSSKWAIPNSRTRTTTNAHQPPYRDSNARTSYSLYYGPLSPHNSIGLVPPALHPQSKPYADVYAAGLALLYLQRTVFSSLSPSPGIRTVVLLTDSAYLVSCMTGLVYAWRENGYRNSKGRLVANAFAVHWVEALVETFEARGVGVRFWKVGRKVNAEAVEMARVELDLGRDERRWDS